jgi:hypothetical protein
MSDIDGDVSEIKGAVQGLTAAVEGLVALQQAASGVSPETEKQATAREAKEEVFWTGDKGRCVHGACKELKVWVFPYNDKTSAVYLTDKPANKEVPIAFIRNKALDGN